MSVPQSIGEMEGEDLAAEFALSAGTEGEGGSDRPVRPQALEDVYRTVQSRRSEAAALGGIAVKLESLARRLERDVLAPGEREVLSGRAIAEVLRTLTHDRTVYHYKDLFARLLAAGFECSGHDPEATMLANVSRSPLWEKAGEPRSGEYQWAR